MGDCSWIIASIPISVRIMYYFISVKMIITILSIATYWYIVTIILG